MLFDDKKFGYNPKDRDSIFNFAREIIGKTFNDIINDYRIKNVTSSLEDEINYESEDVLRNKGNLGQIIEQYYFGLLVNNESRPDFLEADMELKLTPYKINKNGSLSAKERLIISMINYFSIVDQDFYDSYLWDKIKYILIIYYLHDFEISDRLNYRIDYVYKYSPVEDDLKIILEDYEKIKNKVSSGLAHELSEGDTLYLGAATKSSSSKNRTKQPRSNELAKPRAFSFKSSYMTYLLRNVIVPEHERLDSILEHKDIHIPFEEYILSKIEQFKGKSATELMELFEISNTSKNKYSRIIMKILGVNTRNAEEFEKANIIVKTIRVEENNNIKESVSFPTFVINELIQETWEDSSLRNMFLETKFLFVTFKKIEEEYYLNEVKFWNMPESILDEVVIDEWKNTVMAFKNIQLTPTPWGKSGTIIKNNLPGQKDTEVIHVRPHANKSAYLIDGITYGAGVLDKDSDDLPNGDKMTKQCFWINRKYLRDNILST